MPVTGVPVASLRQYNIRMSIQRHLSTEWAVPNDVDVGWSDASFDPDGIAEGATPLERWCQLHWLSGRAGAHGVTTAQFELYSRVPSDPLGQWVTKMGDALTEALRVRRIDLYDFGAVEAADDVETLIAGNCILNHDWHGRVGDPYDMVGPQVEREVWHLSITFRFRLLSDHANADYFPAS